MRTPVARSGVIVLGILLLVVGLPLYASFIHNQYFSDAAGLARTIDYEDSCLEAEDRVREYVERSKGQASFRNLPIAQSPEWQHREEVASVIRLDDDGSPFDHITYYVFCGHQGTVVDTFLVGD